MINPSRIYDSLDIKEVSSYISHFLTEEILRCPELIEKWLKDWRNRRRTVRIKDQYYIHSACRMEKTMP